MTQQIMVLAPNSDDSSLISETCSGRKKCPHRLYSDLHLCAM